MNIINKLLDQKNNFKQQINIYNWNKSMILFLLRKVILFNFSHSYIEMSNKL